MNWFRLIIVAFLGILSLSSFGEADHSSSLSSPRAAEAAARGNSLGFSACAAGRAPFLAVPPVVAPQPVPVVAPSPSPTSAPVKPDPIIVKKPKMPGPCAIDVCTAEYKPVKCKGTVVVDDILIDVKGNGSNQCEATRKMCLGAKKIGFAPEEVDSIRDLICMPNVPEVKPKEEPKPEVIAEFTLDGNAELELLNRDFDPSKNCIQLVRRESVVAVEVSDKACDANPKPVLTIPTKDRELVFNGKAIGAWDFLKDHYRLYELCSGRFAGCKPKIEGKSLKGFEDVVL